MTEATSNLVLFLNDINFSRACSIKSTLYLCYDQEIGQQTPNYLIYFYNALNFLPRFGSIEFTHASYLFEISTRESPKVQTQIEFCDVSKTIQYKSSLEVHIK